MNIKNKIKTFIRVNFYTPVNKDELLSYRNILKILYHKDRETPLMDPYKKGKYYISIPKQNIDLIIEKGKTEIINSEYIHPLNLSDDVYNRVVIKTLEEISKHRDTHEVRIRGKKQNISRKVFNKIK